MDRFYARCRSDGSPRQADHAGRRDSMFRDFNSMSNGASEPLDPRRRRSTGLGTHFCFSAVIARPVPRRPSPSAPAIASRPTGRRPAMVARQVLSRIAPAMGGRDAVPFRYFLHRIGHPCHAVGASRRRLGQSDAPGQPVGVRRGVGSPAYRDAAQPVAMRVKDLLGRMTLEEKIGQMTQAERGAVAGDPRDRHAEPGVGAVRRWLDPDA